MGGLFGGEKKKEAAPTPPPVPKEPPSPLATPVASSETEDQAKKRVGSRSGYGKTIVTGNLAPTMGKKTTFG